MEAEVQGKRQYEDRFRSCPRFGDTATTLGLKFLSAVDEKS